MKTTNDSPRQHPRLRKNVLNNIKDWMSKNSEPARISPPAFQPSPGSLSSRQALGSSASNSSTTSRPRKRLPRSHGGPSDTKRRKTRSKDIPASQPVEIARDADSLPQRFLEMDGHLGSGLLEFPEGLLGEVPHSRRGSTNPESSIGSVENVSLDNIATRPAPAIPNMEPVIMHDEVYYKFTGIISDNTSRVLAAANASRWSGEEGAYEVVIKIFSKYIHFQDKSYVEGPLALRDEYDAHKGVSDYKFSDKDHIPIVPLLAAFQDELFVYLVMPRYQMSLTYLINSRALPLHHVKQYMAELVTSLSFMHKEQKMFHRDLKPDNILLDRNGHLALTDFGLATPFSHGTKDSTFNGTPGYTAPEMGGSGSYDQNHHGDYDILPTEIWSVGCIMFELLTGDRYEDFERRHKYRNLWNDIRDKDALDLLLQLLDQNPARRPSLKKIKSHPFFSIIDWKHLYLMPARDLSHEPRNERPLPAGIEKGIFAFFEEHDKLCSGPWPPRISSLELDFMRHFWTYRDIDKISWKCSPERTAQILAAVR